MTYEEQIRLQIFTGTGRKLRVKLSRMPSRPNSSKHRTSYTRAYGHIPKKWTVHHIDGNNENNDPLNLIALPATIHTAIHWVEQDQKRLFSRAEIESILRVFGYSAPSPPTLTVATSP